MHRPIPNGHRGAIATLLIAPRTWSYYICGACLRELYFTYAGESCPHCDSTDLWYDEGGLPGERGGLRKEFRAEAHSTPALDVSAARPANGNGGRRRSGKRPRRNRGGGRERSVPA